jgi:hypothetical protein
MAGNLIPVASHKLQSQRFPERLAFLRSLLLFFYRVSPPDSEFSSWQADDLDIIVTLRINCPNRF